jgi:hypothetical protein
VCISRKGKRGLSEVWNFLRLWCSIRKLERGNFVGESSYFRKSWSSKSQRLLEFVREKTSVQSHMGSPLRALEIQLKLFPSLSPIQE